MDKPTFDILSFLVGLFSGAGGVLLTEVIGWRKAGVRRRAGKPTVEASGIYSKDHNSIAVVVNVTNPGDAPDTFDGWTLVLDGTTLPWQRELVSWMDGVRCLRDAELRVEPHGSWSGAISFYHQDHIRFRDRLGGDTPEAIAGVLRLRSVNYGSIEVPATVTPIVLLGEQTSDEPGGARTGDK